MRCSEIASWRGTGCLFPEAFDDDLRHLLRVETSLVGVLAFARGVLMMFVSALLRVHGRMEASRAGVDGPGLLDGHAECPLCDGLDSKHAAVWVGSEQSEV